MTDRVAAADQPSDRHLAMMLRRWRVFAGIFLIYLGYALPDLWKHTWPVRIAGLVFLLAFIGIYLGLLPLAAFGPRRRWAPRVLVAMTGIMVAYLVTISGGGIVMATYVAIAWVLLLQPVVSVPLVLVLAAAVTFLPQYVDAWDVHGLQFGVSVPILLVSLAMFGLRSSFANTTALYQARQEVEHLAAEQERLRIARDLHDLLGHALTTVTLKAELAARLTSRDPERAAREMREVADLARQGLADVRATVAGYRELGLLNEIASAREVLAAAGMTAELPAAVEDVPAPARELFAWTVREGVTNAVRHSRAERVAVRIAPDHIEVADDGRGPADSTPGNGLTGLSERAAALGGRLSAGPGPGGGYVLRVELSPDAARAARDEGGDRQAVEAPETAQLPMQPTASR
jgi:two-component system sensor histidine kinase DesK